MVPVNRQGYLCHPNNPSGDKCLANDTFAPSQLTFGGRFFPWKKGFNLIAALDIGVTGVGNFIEEVRADAAVDALPRRGLGVRHAGQSAGRSRSASSRSRSRKARAASIRGFVHEEGKRRGHRRRDRRVGQPPRAHVARDAAPTVASRRTSSTRARTSFAIKADGYKPGQCSTTIGGRAAPRPPPAPGHRRRRPSSLPSGGRRRPARLRPMSGAAARRHDRRQGQGPRDAAAFVPNATIKVVDVAKKELSGTTDAQRRVPLRVVTPGEAQITVDADGLPRARPTKLEVKVRQDNPIELSLKKTPKNAARHRQQGRDHHQAADPVRGRLGDDPPGVDRPPHGDRRRAHQEPAP